MLLELASVSGADPVQLRGEVRHVARMPGGSVHVGIGFIALSAQAEQLLDLLFALPRRGLRADRTRACLVRRFIPASTGYEVRPSDGRQIREDSTWHQTVDRRAAPKA